MLAERKVALAEVAGVLFSVSAVKLWSRVPSVAFPDIGDMSYNMRTEIALEWLMRCAAEVAPLLR